MDTLRFLIGYVLKIAFALFLAAFLIWVITLFIPGVTLKSFVPSFSDTKKGTSTDWLPSPKAYQGLFGKMSPPNEYTNVYVHGKAYDGYGSSTGSYSYSSASFITYTSTGTAVQGGGKYNAEKGVIEYGERAATTTEERMLYVRNLSIYQGGLLESGLSFVGEVRQTMVKNGIFPLVLVDKDRRVIGISTARTTSDWSVPGWTRFEAKITHPVPYTGPCALVFEQALTQEERSRTPVRVPLAMNCKGR